MRELGIYNMDTKKIKKILRASYQKAYPNSLTIGFLDKFLNSFPKSTPNSIDFVDYSITSMDEIYNFLTNLFSQVISPEEVPKFIEKWNNSKFPFTFEDYFGFKVTEEWNSKILKDFFVKHLPKIDFQEVED